MRSTRLDAAQSLGASGARVSPRIDDPRPRRLKIGDVARDDRHAMDQRGGRDECVAIVAGIRHEERRTASRDRTIDGQHASGELRQDHFFQPGAQDRTLLGIAPLGLQNDIVVGMPKTMMARAADMHEPDGNSVKPIAEQNSAAFRKAGVPG